MTLEEFLKLNTNDGDIDILLHLNDKIIDWYCKEELENSIYMNHRFKSFEVYGNDLYIYLTN